MKTVQAVNKDEAVKSAVIAEESTEEVKAMFALEDIERPKKQIQADIEAWENRK